MLLAFTQTETHVQSAIQTVCHAKPQPPTALNASKVFTSTCLILTHAQAVLPDVYRAITATFVLSAKPECTKKLMGLVPAAHLHVLCARTKQFVTHAHKVFIFRERFVCHAQIVVPRAIAARIVLRVWLGITVLQAIRVKLVLIRMPFVSIATSLYVKAARVDFS